METASKFIMPGIIFILTLASGIWLSNTGKPLNTAIFTIHKLIALAAVIVTGIQIYRLFQATEIQVLPIALIILTGLCVLALFVSGALMSIGKPASDILLSVHKVAPFVALVSLAGTVYLYAGRLL